MNPHLIKKPPQQAGSPVQVRKRKPRGETTPRLTGAVARALRVLSAEAAYSPLLRESLRIKFDNCEKELIKL